MAGRCSGSRPCSRWWSRTLSYKIVEQPIRHGAISAVQLRKLTPAIAVALIAAILATTTGGNDSTSLVPAALSAHPISAAAAAYANAVPGSQRVLIVGDSVALRLGESFAKIKTNPPLAVFNIGIPGCVFPPQISSPPMRFPDGHTLPVAPCSPGWEPRAVRRFKPNVVFWAMSPGRGGTYRGEKIEPCAQSYATIYRQSLTKEVAILRATGAKVVLLTTAYTRTYAVPNSDTSTDCENRIKRAVAVSLGVQLVDLFGYICPGGECREPSTASPSVPTDSTTRDPVASSSRSGSTTRFIDDGRR